GCSIFHTGKQHRRPGRSATEKFEISDAIGNNKEWLPGHAARYKPDFKSVFKTDAVWQRLQAVWLVGRWFDSACLLRWGMRTM
ncbi:MAG: hypothetical protein WAO83_11755, partial [Fuerstiella sp.]